MHAMVAGSATSAPRLADVGVSAVLALQGRGNPLGLESTRHAVIVLVDGLGAWNLSERSGNARAICRAPRRVARTTFPSTTATALTTLCTGADPIGHGILGYALFDAASGTVRRQINDWGPGMEPDRWQPVPTVFERAGDTGVRSFAVAGKKYGDTGFSRATLRGTTFVAGRSIEDRFAAAARITRVHDSPTLTYVYVPELDHAGHNHGWRSRQWSDALDEVDAAVSAFRPAGGTTVLLTADHGMIDTPEDGRIYLDELDCADAIRAVAGEPRGAQLVLWDPGDAAAVAAELTSALERRRAGARVMSRRQLLDSALVGDLGSTRSMSEHADRLGHLIVVADDERTTCYDRRWASTGSLRMVGQHGGMSRHECEIPLIVWRWS